MKKVMLLLVLFLVLAVSAAAIYHFNLPDRGSMTTDAVYTGLDRSVSGNALVSNENPDAVLNFAPSFRYIGGQKFVLYGVADTEQYFFVETNPDNELLSLYWIQFEGYLPDNTYQYDYDDSPGRMDLGGYEFYLDTEVIQSVPNKKRKNGTDGARARELLKSKGFSIPLNYTYARLVHLTDESRRKELMVIFIESLAPLGLTGSDLQDGGKDAQRWPEIEQAHLDKIRDTLKLTPR